MTILNRPETKYIYEFEVVTFWMTNENEEEIYMHDSFYTNGFEAEQRALEIGGLIIHNVRIAGKELAE